VHSFLKFMNTNFYSTNKTDFYFVCADQSHKHWQRLPNGHHIALTPTRSHHLPTHHKIVPKVLSTHFSVLSGSFVVLKKLAYSAFWSPSDHSSRTLMLQPGIFVHLERRSATLPSFIRSRNLAEYGVDIPWRNTAGAFGKRPCILT
jgi:hypothetical protein